MHWEISGRLAGACNCGTPCPCWFNEEPTHGSCDAIGIAVADEGYYGDVDLAGCKFGVAYRSTGQIWHGNLQLAIYIDQETPPGQGEALEQILSGRAGGLPEALFSLVADFKGIRRAAISLADSGDTPAFVLGEATTVPLNPVMGRDGLHPVTVQNAMMSFGGVRKLAKTRARFTDPDLGWDWPLAHADFGPIRMSA